jgi:SAM-dependent methyltransferase
MDLSNKQVLDPCCGSRMFWFDKANPVAVFGDICSESHILCDGRRLDVRPDIQMDFTDIPFDDASFRLVVFDPPHLNVVGNGYMSKKYGKLTGDWRGMLQQGFAECLRVLMPGGVLIFKWCEVQIPTAEILKLCPIKPLFGHRSGKRSDTHWVCFIKAD